MKLFRLFSIPSLVTVMMGAAVLAACTSTTSPGYPPGPGAGLPPVVSTDGTLVDERALVALEAAYNVAASAYVAADDRGQIPPAVRERARQALVSSYQALTLARTAYRAGDSPTFATQAAEASRLVAQARELIPK